MRVLSAILILATFLQASPLRACVIEEAVTGNSCHDSQLGVADKSMSGIDAPVSVDCPDDGHSCICKAEKSTASQSQQPAAVNTLFASTLAVHVPVLARAFAGMMPQRSLATAERSAVNLPLLI